MDKPIFRLYPQPSIEQPLKGTYLAHNLRQYVCKDQAFVYTNFITSLDGRIAISRGEKKDMSIPQSITNDRDWWLFQELAVQADLIISSGRYLHDWVKGKAQEILQVDDNRFAELRKWRQTHGLSPQADIAIVSNRLHFPIPDILTAGGRKVFFFTTTNADPRRIQAIEKKTGQVFIAGDRNGVNGAIMINQMTELGYRVIFSSAGPQILHLLLANNVLNRLSLTHANRILGGKPYASLDEGELFKPAIDLTFNSLYLDPPASDGFSQLFITYDRK